MEEVVPVGRGDGVSDGAAGRHDWLPNNVAGDRAE